MTNVYKINWFQKAILSFIFRYIVRQSFWHKHNIIWVYSELYRIAREEFTEDNDITFDYFMSECFGKSLSDSTQLYLKNKYFEDSESIKIN